MLEAFHKCESDFGDAELIWVRRVVEKCLAEFIGAGYPDCAP
jgi:hypothetical protein